MAPVVLNPCPAGSACGGGRAAPRGVRAPAAGSSRRPLVEALSADVSTAFHADPAVSARVRRQFLAFVARSSGGDGAKAVGSAFAERDPFANWSRQAGRDGLRLGDVADALTEYWIENWQIATGSPDPNPGSVHAVRRQVAGILRSTPGFARLSDAQKQEMAEIFIYNTLLQGEVFGGATRRGNSALTARLGDAAVARFRNEMHVDLRSLSLTDQGFVKRG